jgi:hypothetical protein
MATTEVLDLTKGFEYVGRQVPRTYSHWASGFDEMITTCTI